MTKDDLFNRTTGLILKIHELESSLSNPNGDDEVTALQLDLLTVLYFACSKNLSDLSHCLSINLPNCSREVKKLTLKGFLKKNKCHCDRRKTEIALTTLGTNKVEAILHEMKESFFKQNSNWNKQKIKRCIDSINILETELFDSDS